MIWAPVNVDSPVHTFHASLPINITVCSVESDAQTLSLNFWASLSHHTAEGLIHPELLNVSCMMFLA
jgi:hypothetical protein